MNKKYNIINILTDDMGEWAMGCSGNGEVKTPHLDSLAKRGMTLNNCYCVSPVCSPARASIFTGRLPSFHGVQDWIAGGNSPLDNPEGRCIDYLENITLFTELLSDKGYYLGYSGKWHLGDSPSPRKGHSFWYTHAFGGGPYYGATMYKDGKEVVEEEYITDRITDEGLAFLNQTRDEDKPFCLTLSYTAPHSPWDRENHPKDLYDDYYENCPFESAPDLPIHPWHINTAAVGYSPRKAKGDPERLLCLHHFHGQQCGPHTGLAPAAGAGREYNRLFYRRQRNEYGASRDLRKGERHIPAEYV